MVTGQLKETGLEQFVINTFSTITAAAFIAFIGFLFRNPIRKKLNGIDLLALGQTPKIEFVDMQYITDLKYNKKVHFLIKNCGNIDAAHIRLFKCDMENAGNPTSLSIAKLPYERQFTSTGHGESGEAMQIAVDVKLFKTKEAYPDSRLFVEMTGRDGSYFRATIIRPRGTGLAELGEGGFFADHIGRVGKPLPFWRIQTTNTKGIERLERKYDLDLAIG